MVKTAERPQTATQTQDPPFEETPVAILFSGQGLPPEDICSYSQLLESINPDLFRQDLLLAQTVLDKLHGEGVFKIDQALQDPSSPQFGKTSFVQPLVYTLSVVAWEIMRPGLNRRNLVPKVMAGHSLGEYSAATAAGVIPFEKGIEIVPFRGLIMQQACEERESKLSSIRGLSWETVRSEICSKTQAEIALVNAPDLIVVGSAPDQIPQIEQLAQEIGLRGGQRVRVRSLDTAGAFHTSFMRVPAEKLEEFLLKFDFTDPDIPIIANRTGQITISGAALRNHAVKSMENPVLWAESLATIREQVQYFVECGPGNSLTLLNVANGIPDVQTLNINNLL